MRRPRPRHASAPAPAFPSLRCRARRGSVNAHPHGPRLATAGHQPGRDVRFVRHHLGHQQRYAKCDAAHQDHWKTRAHGVKENLFGVIGYADEVQAWLLTNPAQQLGGPNAHGHRQQDGVDAKALGGQRVDVGQDDEVDQRRHAHREHRQVFGVIGRGQQRCQVERNQHRQRDAEDVVGGDNDHVQVRQPAHCELRLIFSPYLRV